MMVWVSPVQCLVGWIQTRTLCDPEWGQTKEDA